MDNNNGTDDLVLDEAELKEGFGIDGEEELVDDTLLPEDEDAALLLGEEKKKNEEEEDDGFSTYLDENLYDPEDLRY